MFRYLRALAFTVLLGLISLNCRGENLRLGQVTVQSAVAVEQSSLQERLKSLSGEEITESLLQKVLDQVNEHYRNRGYPSSVAYFPHQQSTDGDLKVDVLIPKLGMLKFSYRLMLTEDTRERLFDPLMSFVGERDDGRLWERLRNLAALDSIHILGLEDDLTKAFPDSNALKLIVHSASDYYVQGFFDNHGSKAAGRYRAGLYAQANNLTRHADSASLFVARSSEAQDNFSLSYKLPLNSYATLLGASLCYSNYELGEQYRKLGAQGHSLTASLFLAQPLYNTRSPYLNRERAYKGTLELAGRYRQLTDEFKTYSLKFKKHTSALSLSFTHESKDPGFYNWEAAAVLTCGQLKNDDEWELGNEGSYTVFNASFTGDWAFPSYRQLHFRNNTELQYSSSDLDSSERFEAGGPKAVGAFSPGAASGDSGYLQQLSLRWYYDTFYLEPHFDVAHVKVNSRDSSTLKGLGLQLGAYHGGLKVSVDLNHALGGRGEGESGTQLWLRLSYGKAFGGQMTPYF
ncbi:MAG: ShlB/FhaC/HecB family hemolysin secretion/activation protein [Succinivibrio sp.]|nr:ShlB/FhaC/HecB family hemolysin secretion/activation protein [Succinivibrio sp.]